MSSGPVMDLTLLFQGQPLKFFKPVQIETRYTVQHIPSAYLVLEPTGDAHSDLWKHSSEDAARCQPGTEVHVQCKQTTLFSGVVVQQTWRWHDRQLALRLKHPLHRLVSTYRSQLFENQSDADILRHLLQAQRIPVGTIDGMAAKQPQLVQWACSDWQWLRSRLSAYGVWLMPKPEQLECRFPKLAASADHTLMASRSSDTQAAVVDAEWQFSSETQPSSLTVNYWDVAQQAMSRTVRANASSLGQGGLDPTKVAALSSLPWQLSHAVPLTPAEAQAQADARLLAQHAAAVQARLTVLDSAESLQYELGQTLALEGFEKHFEGKGIISEVRHHWQRGALRTTVAIGQDALRAVDAGLLPRAPGLTIGVVQKYRADPSNLNRLRVSVPVLGTEPLWARLGAPYASNGSGLCLYPEPGDEVVLAFLDEDPRYPVILGAMHNPKNKAPFPPSEENAKKALIFVRGETQQGLVFDTQEISAVLESGKDRLTLHKGGQIDSEQNIAINGQKIDVVAKQSLTLTSNEQQVAINGQKVAIQAKQQFTAEGTMGVTLKGAKVDLTN